MGCGQSKSLGEMSACEPTRNLNACTRQSVSNATDYDSLSQDTLQLPRTESGKNVARGTRVRVADLDTAPELAGLFGTIQAVLRDQDAGRVILLLDMGNKINIKAGDLHAISGLNNVHKTQADLPPDGQHTYTFEDGTTYEGDFLDGMRHGQGTALSAEGHRYEGGWYQDQLHGPGVYIDVNGSSFTGEWDMGLAGETERPASNARNISNISDVSNSSNVEPTHRNTGSVSQLDHTEVLPERAIHIAKNQEETRKGSSTTTHDWGQIQRKLSGGTQPAQKIVSFNDVAQIHETFQSSGSENSSSRLPGCHRSHSKQELELAQLFDSALAAGGVIVRAESYGTPGAGSPDVGQQSADPLSEYNESLAAGLSVFEQVTGSSTSVECKGVDVESGANVQQDNNREGGEEGGGEGNEGVDFNVERTPSDWQRLFKADMEAAFA